MHASLRPALSINALELDAIRVPRQPSLRLAVFSIHKKKTPPKRGLCRLNPDIRDLRLPGVVPLRFSIVLCASIRSVHSARDYRSVEQTCSSNSAPRFVSNYLQRIHPWLSV